MDRSIRKVGTDRARLGEEFPEEFGGCHACLGLLLAVDFRPDAFGLTQFYHATFSGGSLDFLRSEHSLDTPKKEGFSARFPGRLVTFDLLEAGGLMHGALPRKER